MKTKDTTNTQKLDDKVNVNSGHRERLRQRYRENGLQSFLDHEVLELLLFQYIPYKDTNKLAHQLLKEFGSLAGVLDADEQALINVEGMGEATACNIAILKDIWFRYKKSKQRICNIQGYENIIAFAQNLIGYSPTEKALAVFTDHATRYLGDFVCYSDSSKTAIIDVTAIVNKAKDFKAGGVIFVHNHPKGEVSPSLDDNTLTEKLYLALASTRVTLLDHVIVNETDKAYSYYRAGFIKKLDEKYKCLKNI